MPCSARNLATCAPWLALTCTTFHTDIDARALREQIGKDARGRPVTVCDAGGRPMAKACRCPRRKKIHQLTSRAGRTSAIAGPHPNPRVKVLLPTQEATGCGRGIANL